MKSINFMYFTFGYIVIRITYDFITLVMSTIKCWLEETYRALAALLLLSRLRSHLIWAEYRIHENAVR